MIYSYKLHVLQTLLDSLLEGLTLMIVAMALDIGFTMLHPQGMDTTVVRFCDA